MSIFKEIYIYICVCIPCGTDDVVDVSVVTGIETVVVGGIVG